jgi:hypothetical protein
MLRDGLKGPICFNSFKPSGFFIHRLVYHSEIRRYAGKNAVPYCTFVTKRVTRAVVAGCRSVGAGGGGEGSAGLLKVFFVA